MEVRNTEIAKEFFKIDVLVSSVRLFVASAIGYQAFSLHMLFACYKY